MDMADSSEAIEIADAADPDDWDRLGKGTWAAMLNFLME